MLEETPSPPRLRRLTMLALLAAAVAVLLFLALPAPAEPLPERLALGAQNLYHRARNGLLGPPLVGIQIGHLEAAKHPAELAPLRVSTGGIGGGLVEVEVNAAVAEELASLLERQGIETQLIPATVPPGFRADAFVALHADSSEDAHRRGYKSSTFLPARNRWDATLKNYLDASYLLGSSLPDDHENVTDDMYEYYAFNRRFRHSLAKATPAVIVEMGYLSHPADRELLEEPERIAELLARGIIAFLAERGRLVGLRQR